ncbi:hypothetical protein NX059_010180 [Plenodomus lindquistii]|nr:hypothetical protein NX059_010180 [Plenodomus lindquistii]
MSTANPSPAPRTIRKLHKPPTVATIHTPHERPRKKLQKRHTAPDPQTHHLHQQHQQQQEKESTLFLLQYEPYPPTASKSEILGVYSSINTVTAGAFKHGAYAFSKEGMVDGSEYLSANGRIKILRTTLQSSGPTASVPEKTILPSGEPVRLDIPHPDASVTWTWTYPPPRPSSAHSPTLPTLAPPNNAEATQKPQENDKRKGRQVFLALHQTKQITHPIAVLTTKSLAWAACLKDKAWLACSDVLEDEQRSVGEGNCPMVSVRVRGGERQSWCVRVAEVDGHVVREGKGEGAGVQGGGVEDVRRVLEGIGAYGGDGSTVARGVRRKDVGGMGVGREGTGLPVGVRDV